MQFGTSYFFRRPLIRKAKALMILEFQGRYFFQIGHKSSGLMSQPVRKLQKRSLAGLNEYFGNVAKVQWTFERACGKAGKRPS